MTEPINTYEYDGTNLESSDVGENPMVSTIPSSVAVNNQQRMDQYDSSDPSMDDSGKNYDSRYDGSLQDLTHGMQLGNSSNDDLDDNDDDDDDSSFDENKGYLSTGDIRSPNILLMPYVGDRPPTPPSPVRKSTRGVMSPKAVTTTSSHPLHVIHPDESPVKKPMEIMEIQRYDDISLSAHHHSIQPENTRYDSATVDPNSDPVASTRYPFNNDPPMFDRPESAGPHYRNQSNGELDHHAKHHQQNPPESYAGYDEQNLYVPHSPSYEDVEWTSPQVDELTDVVHTLVQNQSKNRRITYILVCAVICLLIALVAVVGGVLALLFLDRGNIASPNPSTMVATPTSLMHSSIAPSSHPISAASQPTRLINMMSRVPTVPPTVSPQTNSAAKTPVLMTNPPTMPPSRIMPPSLQPQTTGLLPISSSPSVGSNPPTLDPRVVGSTPSPTFPPAAVPLSANTVPPTAASISIPIL
jgi:hypothetical protein